MINEFYTKLFVISRPTWSTDDEGNSFSEETEVDQFNGHIQQAQAEDVQSLGLTFTKAFSIWCPLGIEVLEGDSLESIDGLYSVKAVMKYENGINKHQQLLVQYDGVRVIGS